MKVAMKISKKLNRILFCVFFCYVFLFSSCKINKQGKPADLNKIDGLATSAEWAVITSPYVAFRSGSSFNAQVIAHGRQGDICEVKGKKIEKDKTTTILWYHFDEGWLSENDLQICTNRMQADKKSADMLK